VYAPRDEHDEHSVAARGRALDDLAVVRRPRNDGDASLELGELADAFLPAHADHFVAPIQRVLDHVLPELPGRTDRAARWRPRGVHRPPAVAARAAPPRRRTRWGVLEDLQRPGTFIEQFLLPSWGEHLRQHQRATVDDMDIIEGSRALDRRGGPLVRHWLAAGATIDSIGEGARPSAGKARAEEQPSP
jgi:hypothetical protein